VVSLDGVLAAGCFPCLSRGRKFDLAGRIVAGVSRRRRARERDAARTGGIVPVVLLATTLPNIVGLVLAFALWFGLFIAIGRMDPQGRDD
jgi:hypothetical protein